MFDFEEAIISMKDSSEFQEKLFIDMDEEQFEEVPVRSRKQRLNSWNRKRMHKKKMVRRFLTMNPAMDYSNMTGRRYEQAIYINCPCGFDGEYHNHRMEYTLNPYTKVFFSTRGDLRVYQGNIFCLRGGSYMLVNKNKDLKRITNHRIRRASMEAVSGASISYCKKCYGPFVDDRW